MHLKVYKYPVRSIAWGESTNYEAGQLIISRQEILDHLCQNGDLSEIEVTDMSLILPGTKTRVVNIFDIMCARARLGTGAIDYPGVLGPIQSVGHGETACLDDFSILTISSQTDKYNKLLDMSGIGTTLTPHAGQCHLAVRTVPKQPDMLKADYYYALKRLGLRVGSYLAGSAAKSSPTSTPQTQTYTLDPHPQSLPKVVYVCMIASHQKFETGEPVLYGDDVAGMLPTILHPNEVLDGALVSPYWNMAIDPYSFQNNPIVLGLYERHGKDIDFAGVVVNVSHITRKQRERSIMMVSNLVKSVLGADGAIISKVGGGIPVSDMMLTIESLEKRGVCTCAVVWSDKGDSTIEDSLSAYSPAANAIASAGVQDEWLTLSEHDEVVGGSVVGPFTDDPNDKPQPANGALHVRYRDISGAINQLGASCVAQLEI